MFSPVGGEIIEVNEALDGEEETVNEDPYGAGWLVKIKVTDGDLGNCLDAAAYGEKISQ